MKTPSAQNDSAGNVVATTDALGRTTRYTYDVMNRLVRVVSPSPWTGEGVGGGETTYSYDLNWNLTGVTDPDSSLSFAYDPLDRVSRTQSSVLGAQSSPVIDYTRALGSRLACSL